MTDHHCKICMLQDRCDVPGCALAYLAEQRKPVTDEERIASEHIRQMILQLLEKQR